MEAAERAAGAQAAGPAASAAPASGGLGGVEMYESTRHAARTKLGKTVGVQRHQKWYPLYVAQIQAPSAKDPSSVQTQWLPKYKQKEHAALAYDIANTWRLLRGVAGVTEEKAKFNFPDAGYLGDKALCALLEPCSSFRDVTRVIKELLPPSASPPERRLAGAAGQGQDGTPRRTKTARSGVISIELTAARLRDCRVYLTTDALERGFPEAAAMAAAEQAWGKISWAGLHIQATAADPQSGAQRVFELPFGVPGRDGLPMRASSLRPLFDLLGAQPGNVLQLHYTGYGDRAVQVRASLAVQPGGRAAGSAGGGSVLPGGQQPAAVALDAEQEAAAELLGLWQTQAEGLLPACSIREGSPSPLASPASSRDPRKRTHDAGFGSGGSGSSEQPVAKRRALEPGGSAAGFAEPGLQPLGAHPEQPLPAQPLSKAPVHQPVSQPPLPQQQQQQQQDQQQDQQDSIVHVQLAAVSSQSGHPRGVGSGQQQAEPGRPRERALQPAASVADTSLAGSRGAASAAPDSVQQAVTLLAAAQQADAKLRPGQQMRAAMETLRLMGVERTLRQEYANMYAKLSMVQQEVQVLILEGLLRESDAAAEVGAHVREELAQQQRQ